MKQQLIDSLLSNYTLNEYHEVLVNAPTEGVYQAVKETDFGESKTIVTLFKLGGMPPMELNLHGFTHDGNFVLLGENEPEEIGLGLLFTNKFTSTTPEEFMTGYPEARLRVVWNFHCQPVDDKTTRLSTETRIKCSGTVTKLLFRCYWFCIRPFSGLIRINMLKLIKKNAEQLAVI